jgi:hypothetical protein
MRKFIALLVVFYTANCFAADTTISRVIPNKANSDNSTVQTTAETQRVARRGANQSANGDVENRAAASRTISRVVNNKQSDTNTRSQKTGVVSRSGTKNTRASMQETTGGQNKRVAAASINSTAAVRRAGVVLRASTAEFGGRATIGNTGVQTGSNMDEQVRSVHSRAGIFGNSVKKQQTVPTAESIAEAKDILERTADLNSVCQQQYNDCMDQFCAVVDTNQKRCSCSANLAKYAKAQKAVEEANIELNDVAQRIRYVGLSADEIRAIMSETEAEQAMSRTRDNTTNRSMLEDIADMIKDPTASTVSYTQTSSGNMMLDMDMDFSSDSGDMFGLDMFNNSSSDISNKRGRELYKEATKRCKSVLNSCKDAGGTEAQITGNYDLAIDKDCIAYEQGLEKLNKTLVSNVRSANLMLQKARLSVMQNKNQYDTKGCVGALETCMLDEMVCGENYIKCVDPTKKYIDENGNVVLGRNIAAITDIMTNFNNSKINSEFIKSSINDTTCENRDGACIVGYLMSKIGTGPTVKEGGLCRAVLDKCQQVSYNSGNKKSTYNPYNDVIVNYIQRAMVNIKAAQSKIISEYASTCMANISTCYNQQVNQVSSWTTSASADSIYSVMTGACYNVALTCGYAVFAYDLPMAQKVASYTEACNSCKNTKNCTATDTCSECASVCNANTIDKQQKLALIQGISDLFYQSLLCPDNAKFVAEGAKQVSDNGTIGGYVNARCQCEKNYTVYDGACVTKCADTEYRNNLGVCVTCSGTLGGKTSDQTEYTKCTQ